MRRTIPRAPPRGAGSHAQSSSWQTPHRPDRYTDESCARGYVDDRALPERLRFPRFHAESGEMLGFAHIPTGTRNQLFFKIRFEKARGGSAISRSAPILRHGDGRDEEQATPLRTKNNAM